MYQGRNSDGRLLFLSRLDLYAQHQIRFGRRYRFTLSANQGIDTQALIAEQRLVRDARFLMASRFQALRTIRLGVTLGF